MRQSRPQFKKKNQQASDHGRGIASNERTAGPSSKPSLSNAAVAPVYTMCINDAEASQACEVLAAAPYILVDCEGCDMNALSLMQLGTPHAEHIFLFDFLALSSPASRIGIVALLSNPLIIKVFWDGRSDYWDLRSTCGVHTTPVLDLQLVDIHSRAVRNLDRYAHISRLMRKTSPMALVKKLQLDDVHVLNGMDNAIREHRVDVALKDAVVNKMHSEGHADEWLKRPLPKFLLDYAAADIVRIAALFDCFEKKRYLPAGMLPAFEVYSERYYASSAPLTLEENIEGNVYKRSGILPLNVLPVGFGYASIVKYRPPPLGAQRGDFPCNMCSSRLPRHCFPFGFLTTEDRDQHVKMGRYVGPPTGRARSTSCKVCTVHLEREKFAAQEKERKQKELEEKERQAQAEVCGGAAPLEDHPPVTQRVPAKQKQE